MFAVQADGASVLTIEGLAKDGKLHPVQEAFRENHGLQCGFCTPGMIMTAVDMIRRKPVLDRETIRHELEGNICRCTGYHNIVSAIEDAAKRIAWRCGVIPYTFAYRARPRLADAEAQLAFAPDAKLLAGGQTLIATMKQRLANPSILIDISASTSCRSSAANGERIAIGAGSRSMSRSRHPPKCSKPSRRSRRSPKRSAIPPCAHGHAGRLARQQRSCGRLSRSGAGLTASSRQTATTIAADDFFTGHVRNRARRQRDRHAGVLPRSREVPPTRNSPIRPRAMRWPAFSSPKRTRRARRGDGRGARRLPGRRDGSGAGKNLPPGSHRRRSQSIRTDTQFRYPRVRRNIRAHLVDRDGQTRRRGAAKRHDGRHARHGRALARARAARSRSAPS